MWYGRPLREPVQFRLDVLDSELPVDGSELQVCDLVDPAEAGKAHVADAGGTELATGTDDLELDLVDEVVDRLFMDGTFVRSPLEPAAQLEPVECLTAAVTLANDQGPVLGPLVCGEAIAAG